MDSERRSWLEKLEEDRGASLALLAVSAAVLLGMAALGIDIGMVATARTQAQRTADAAALAGAGVYVNAPGNKDLARDEAQTFALENDVMGDPVILEDADVTFPAPNQVKVTVVRTEARGNPIETIFARVLGIGEVDVTADATAEATTAGAANCLLPTALADKWDNQGTPAFDPSEGDSYEPPGYTEDDIGSEIILKPAETGQASPPGADPEAGNFEPGWWYLWHPLDGSGVRTLADQIVRCIDPGSTKAIGDWVMDQNGSAQSIVRAFEELIAQDPDAQWNTAWRPGNGQPQIINGDGMESPRIRPVAMFDPRNFTKQGPDHNFQIINFAAVFVERVGSGPPGLRSVYGRLLGFTGLDPGEGPPGSAAKAIRLIE